MGGYTDSKDDDAYNLEFPIADNATPDGQALNRRAVVPRTNCGPAN